MGFRGKPRAEYFVEATRPGTSTYSQCFPGISVGAFSILPQQSLFKIKTLGREFGGYTAHHPIAFEDVRGHPETQEHCTKTPEIQGKSRLTIVQRCPGESEGSRFAMAAFLGAFRRVVATMPPKRSCLRPIFGFQMLQFQAVSLETVVDSVTAAPGGAAVATHHAGAVCHALKWLWDASSNPEGDNFCSNSRFADLPKEDETHESLGSGHGSEAV